MTEAGQIGSAVVALKCIKWQTADSWQYQNLCFPGFSKHFSVARLMSHFKQVMTTKMKCKYHFSQRNVFDHWQIAGKMAKIEWKTMPWCISLVTYGDWYLSFSLVCKLLSDHVSKSKDNCILKNIINPWMKTFILSLLMKTVNLTEKV